MSAPHRVERILNQLNSVSSTRGNVPEAIHQLKAEIEHEKDQISSVCYVQSNKSLAASRSLPSQLSLDQWLELKQEPMGTSSAVVVTQAQVDAFALITSDHQFIHQRGASVKQSSAKSPFKQLPIAHGFLVLSLLAGLLNDLQPKIEHSMFAINYGLERVRFVKPVPIGATVRAKASVNQAKVIKRPDSASNAPLCAQAEIAASIEILENSEWKSAVTCIWILRHYVTDPSA